MVIQFAALSVVDPHVVVVFVHGKTKESKFSRYDKLVQLY